MSARAFEVGSALEPGTSRRLDVRVFHDGACGLHALLEGGATAMPFGDELDVAERALRAFADARPRASLDALADLVKMIERRLREAHARAAIDRHALFGVAPLSLVAALLGEGSIAIVSSGTCRAYRRPARLGKRERITLDDTLRDRGRLREGAPPGASWRDAPDVVLGPSLTPLGDEPVDRIDLVRLHPSAGDLLVLTSTLAPPGLAELDAPTAAQLLPADELARRIAVAGAIEASRGAAHPTSAAAAIVVRALASSGAPPEGPYR